MVPTYVEFGNDKVIEGYRDPKSDDPDLVRYRHLDGQRVTRLTYPDGIPLDEALVGTITAIGYHLAEDTTPQWFDSDDAGLKARLCDHFGVNPAKKKPKTWGAGVMASGAETVLAFLPASLALHLTVLWAFLMVRLTTTELRTLAGRDYQARTMGDPASTGTGVYAPAIYLGLTEDAAAPLAADTGLAGEITTGTLTRAAAIYAHTTGTASYTLTKTFTSDQSITVRKVGVFNAPTLGTMVFESLMNEIAILVSGDSLQITETVTL